MKSADKLNSIATPVSEVEIDTILVRSLLKQQHPDLAGLAIQPIDSGWDNIIFRLGNRLSVRLPRRQAAAKLIENEQTWLPVLARRFPFPVPTPYRIGQPALGYPWRWSILPWLAGVTADREEPLADRAKLFASFLRSLHVPAPANAPVNSLRGVPLTQRSASIEERIQRIKLKTNSIAPQIERIWQESLKAPIDVSPTWLHGDLHPRNILVENGAIAGIIDWGDMTSGDIATDLAAIWMLFADRKARSHALAEYGNVSEATLQRAKGWAILFGVILLDTGSIDNPTNAAIGERILSRVAEDG